MWTTLCDRPSSILCNGVACLGYTWYIVKKLVKNDLRKFSEESRDILTIVNTKSEMSTRND